MISAPLASRASTTIVAAASPAMMRFRAGNRHGPGGGGGAAALVGSRGGPPPRRAPPPRRVLRDDEAALADPARELTMRRRVVAVDAAPEHAHGHAARRQGAAVRLAVDSAREAADNDEARGGELAREGAGHLGAVRRAGTRADDRDGRPGKEADVAGAAQEESRRRIVDRAEKRREARIRAGEPTQAAAFELDAVGRGVEAPLEGCEARAPRRVDDMCVGGSGERGQGEVAHGAESSFGDL